MSSVDPTAIGPEPQSIVARNEKSAGSGGDCLAEAVPASASVSTAVTRAIRVRRKSSPFGCASLPPNIGGGLEPPDVGWTHVGLG